MRTYDVLRICQLGADFANRAFDSPVMLVEREVIGLPIPSERYHEARRQWRRPEDGTMFHRERIEFETRGRGTYEITQKLDKAVERSGVAAGSCHVFIHHTSASLIVCENADPTVRRDLEMFAARLVPDGDPEFVHDSEGPDDMAAHLRSILTLTSLTIPVDRGRCDLGTWQGVFLWEHRARPHRRRLTITVTGTDDGAD